MACVTPRQVSNILSPLLSPSAAKQSPAATSSPRNRENTYRTLLSSYATYDWCNKPLPLSPLQCAKWGWLSGGRDILQCKICKVKLQFVCTFQPWQKKQYEKVCKEFGIQIQTSHLSVCPWSNRPAPDDAVFGGRISLIYDKSDFISTFFFLRKSFAEDSTPEIEVPGKTLRKIWPVLSVIFKTLKSHENNESGSGMELTVNNATCLILSLFGWRKAEDSLPTVQCRLCLRTLGLWNFRSLTNECSSTIVDTSEMSEYWSSDDYTSHVIHSSESTPISCRSRMASSTGSEVSHSKSEETDETFEKSTPEQMSPDKEIDPRSDSNLTNQDTVEGNPPEKLKLLEETTSPNKEDSSSSSPKDTDDETDIKYGNPDIFLCKPSFDVSKLETLPIMKQKQSETEPKETTDNVKASTEIDGEDASMKVGSSEASSENKGDPMDTNLDHTEDETANKTSEFKTPEPSTTAVTSRSTRALRSRSKAASAETLTPERTSQRKRKSKTAESPTTPKMMTRTRSSHGRSPSVTPPPQQLRKRRRSKLEMTEQLISDIMKATPSVLKLSSNSPAKLNVMKQHHYWCPWVSTLPSYHINKATRTNPDKLKEEGHTKVNVIEQTDEQGWETLLFHLSTVKSPGNAWIAVHNMLQDCVGKRK